MVLAHPFHNPSQTIEGSPFDEALFKIINGRSWALVTSDGWRARGAVDKLIWRCGEPNAAYYDCQENPTVQTVLKIAKHLKSVDIYVALGGGSVIDAVKGAAAFCALNNNMDTFLDHLREGVPLPEDLPALPIIAIPTTAGTGSEVTPWGTIWGDGGIKHSVSNRSLYPSFAVLDPTLTKTMPKELTVATGLDALSHSMESVWNRHHTTISDAMASQAISLLREGLLKVVVDPNDLSSRQTVQTASTIAGLAMGTTQTALAHSISYPFTSLYGVPHGLACSFTLPEIARYNMLPNADRLKPIAKGMGCKVEQIPVQIELWFKDLGVSELILHYVSPEVINELDDNLITRSRAANNIRAIDSSGAREIARNALNRFNNVLSD